MPVERRRETKRVVVGLLENFPPGKPHAVEVDGRALAIFNIDGALYALRDVCPHMGAPLSQGPILGTVTATGPGEFCYDPATKRVRCPWHGWEYDLATGRSSFDPARNRVRQYSVSVESGESLADGRVEGPFTAETFEVSVEGEYVVVEV